MKYMGSKARIAKDLAPIINKIIKENGIDVYIEPFVGGANMIQHIKCEHLFGCDNNTYLIAFWQAIQKGWFPFSTVTMNKEFYQTVKDHKEIYSPEIVALCGLCATYNAKWFGGYAGIVKTKIGTFRNYYEEAVRNVLKQAPLIKDVCFICADYQEIETANMNALYYCDPPYQNTTGYQDTFDHSQYWEWVRKTSVDNIVLCSEYTAPDDFICIWSKQLTNTLDKNSRSKAVEKLFIHKSVADRLKIKQEKE
jgi:DNA adenine methylase